MAVIADESQREFGNQLAHALGYDEAHVVVGTPLDAVEVLKQRAHTPTYIMIDIGDRNRDVLPELDTMAENCEVDTRVVVVGTVNDVSLYRELRQRGVIEYFPRPAKISDLRTVLMYEGTETTKKGDSTIITFMSAASGDGSSTVALNTAYCLAEEFKQPTVLIDMDFQFGMIARNLDLTSPFGIKEIFEHPDRSIDATLIERMMVGYGENLKVIAAPNDLRLMPNIKPEGIRDLLLTLREQYDFVIVDIPHVWSTWVAAALGDANHNILVAQLWLRSVTHSARLMNAWRDIGIDEEAISIVINRSGAKFKEGVRTKDYERVCNKKIDYYLANDIKSISAAENQGKTILEVSNAILSRQFREFSGKLMASFKGEAYARAMTKQATPAAPEAPAAKTGTLGSLFGGKG